MLMIKDLLSKYWKNIKSLTTKLLNLKEKKLKLPLKDTLFLKLYQKLTLLLFLKKNNPNKK